MITVMMNCGDGKVLVWGLSGAVFMAAGTRSQGKNQGVIVIYRAIKVRTGGSMVAGEAREPMNGGSQCREGGAMMGWWGLRVSRDDRVLASVCPFPGDTTLATEVIASSRTFLREHESS